MGSKREEERNEKIIRGLMKLPPNRRCINCNSLGPQYVCTNFWTFVCMQCSGVHREFTHRVKSVSMAKFTSQEVDALQKGGNQRARELFLKTWNPQSQRLPDNSNPDKVREFIKHVYVDKRYAIEKLSDKPPRDPQTLRSHENETRRASSYHSYSQSPPYDFQYEERRYGKPIPSLSRKPGSDRGPSEEKLSSFSSPSHSSDQAYDEGSWPRVSDYSVSSGGDPFRSDILSPSSQRETWSPFSESETSSNFSSEMHGHHMFLHSSNARGGIRRVRHPQRTTSSGSIGSLDSMSFKSVNSMGLHEVAAEAQQSVETSHENASSFPSLPQSSTSSTFNGLDLFNEPFAPQHSTSTPTTVCNSQSPESLLPQPLDLFQQSHISSAPTLTEQQPSETLQPPLNFTGLPQQQPAAPLNGKISDAVMPQQGGWATFDASQNLSIISTENSIPAAVPSSDGSNLRDFNPSSRDQRASNQKSPGLELTTSTHTWQGNLQIAETTTNNTQVWNAFEDSTVKQPTEFKLEDRGCTSVQNDPNERRSLGSGVYEVLHNDWNFRTSYGIDPPSSSLSMHPSMALNSFSLVSEAGVRPVATAHKPTNPFDLPCDADLAPSNMTQFWDMSSLQAALPNNQAPATYVSDANESWFPQTSIPSYIPGAVSFDPPNGSLEYIVGQVPSNQIPSGPAQGPVASIRGNPFA